MRSQTEIINRILTRQQHDPFGFETGDYLLALTKESAKKLEGDILKRGASKKWNRTFPNDEAIKKQCTEYMPFAWEKANSFRGISASRSISHYIAWLWLLGTNEFDNIDDYQFYGKDELRRICKYLGIDADKYDDGVRLNVEP